MAAIVVEGVDYCRSGGDDWQLLYQYVADLWPSCSGSRSTSVAERPGGTCRERGVDPGQLAELKKHEAYAGN